MGYLLFLEIILLFLLSRATTTELSILFYSITKSEKATISLMALVFLPGTIIHEFSHAIMARLLFVPVGKMELMPHSTGNSLKLGSVQVGKTDYMRNFFIGAAPFFVGVTLILFILFFAIQNSLFSLWWAALLIVYSVFVIANTMFSSKKDMEGAVQFFIIVGIILGALYIGGFRFNSIDWGFLNGLSLSEYTLRIMWYLLIPLGIDVVLIVISRILTRRVY